MEYMRRGCWCNCSSNVSCQVGHGISQVFIVSLTCQTIESVVGLLIRCLSVKSKPKITQWDQDLTWGLKQRQPVEEPPLQTWFSSSCTQFSVWNSNQWSHWYITTVESITSFIMDLTPDPWPTVKEPVLAQIMNCHPDAGPAATSH